MLWARAASRIFLTLGMLAWQRGRTPQLAFMKSSRSNAVVLGSTVTGLSSGAGGVFTVAQSATMSPAKAGCAATIATIATAEQANRRAKFVMVSSLDAFDLARDRRGMASSNTRPSFAKRAARMAPRCHPGRQLI